MFTLWMQAALLSSSEHFGTKKLTDTLGYLANCMVNSLFAVDRPPLEDFHSLAKCVMRSVVPDIAL